MESGVKLTVHYNGTIIVDGGTLQNADLALNSGCHVIVKNGGSIIMQSGKFFDAPFGATGLMENMNPCCLKARCGQWFVISRTNL